MRTKFIAVVILGVLFSSFPMVASAESSKEDKKNTWVPFQGALLKKIQVPSRHDIDVYGMRFTILNGKSEDVLGLDLGIGLTEADDVKGLQFAGFANIVRGDMLGLQLAGIANIVKDDMLGLQLGGGNVVDGNVRGVQLGLVYNDTRHLIGLQVGLINKIDKLKMCMRDGGIGTQVGVIGNFSPCEFTGLQVGGLGNGGGFVKGCQIGGLGNFAAVVNGFQFAGVGNFAAGINGFQIGITNYISEEITGVQVGVVNIAKKVKGLQIGLVNYCRKMKGFQVGVINIIKEGALPFFPIANASFSF